MDRGSTISSEGDRRWWWAAWGVIALSLALVPVLAHYAARAMRGHQNRVADWLPASYDETRQLAWFRERFVADQFVVISWEGCTLGDLAAGEESRRGDDPRIERLCKELERVRFEPGERRSGADASGPLCFASVTSGRRTLDELTSGPSALTLAEAERRIRGALLAEEGRQTCVVAVISDEVLERIARVLATPSDRALAGEAGRLSPLYAAIERSGVRLADAHLGGPPMDNVAIDEEGQRTLARLAGLSGAFGLALAWWSLRSVRMTALVFLCGVGSAVAAMAIVGAGGGGMDAILMSMPALVYVLAVSGALHLLNYYSIGAEQKGLDHAVGEAIAHAWRPALMCALTTALGLLSLLASDITPIRRFGIYSASGVMVTLLVLFGFLPGVLVVWPWRSRLRAPIESEAAPNAPPPAEGVWHSLAMTIDRRSGLVLAASLGLIGLLAAGLPRTTTSIDLLKLFSPDAKLIRDYRWFEDHLGRLVPAEIVLRFPQRTLRERLRESATARSVASSFTFLERLETVRRVEAAIRDRLGPGGADLVGATMSAATFAPDTDAQTSVARSARRYTVNQELLAERDRLVGSGYLRTDPQTGDELWRITVRCAAFHTGQRDAVTERLRRVVAPVVAGVEGATAALADLTAGEIGEPGAFHVAIYAPPAAVADEPPGGTDPAATHPESAAASAPAAGGHAALSDGAQAAGALLRDRGVRVGVVSASWSDTDAKTRQALARQDAVLALGPDDGAVAAMRDAGVRVADASPSVAVEVIYTGVLPIVYKAQRELLNSLVESTWWSFGTILPLMVLVCRSLLGGFVVMLPNVLPVLVVFGGMGWLGTPVDIGSMMAASIALGVAVDDTIHFLAWYREDVRTLGSRSAAVRTAYERSATPTLQAGLVNGLGLSVFAMSSFVPTQRFGVIMLAILGAGIVAELVLLPALLLSPIGRVFGGAAETRGAEPVGA